MKSTIRIELDENRNPVIQVNEQTSDDLKDRLITDFRHGFDHQSNWAKVEFIPRDWGYTMIIRPIGVKDLEKEGKDMIEESKK